MENLVEAPVRVYRQPADRTRATALRLLAGVDSAAMPITGLTYSPVANNSGLLSIAA